MNYSPGTNYEIAGCAYGNKYSEMHVSFLGIESIKKMKNTELNIIPQILPKIGLLDVLIVTSMQPVQY